MTSKRAMVSALMVPLAAACVLLVRQERALRAARAEILRLRLAPETHPSSALATPRPAPEPEVPAQVSSVGSPVEPSPEVLAARELVAALVANNDDQQATHALSFNHEAELSELLAAVWPGLDRKCQSRLIMLFVHRRHPRAVDLLALGMDGGHVDVQLLAGHYLRRISLVDFTIEPQLWPDWRDATRGLSLEKAEEWSAQHLVGQLASCASSEIARLLKIAGGGGEEHLMRVRGAGLYTILGQRLAGQDAEDVRQTLRALVHVPPDKTFLLGHVVPLLARPALRHEAMQALGRERLGWAVPILMPYVDGDEADCCSASLAIGKIGETSAIQDLIGAIRRDNTRKTIYGVGYFALGPLTGVAWSETHDAAWWDEWWAQNRWRYGK